MKSKRGLLVLWFLAALLFLLPGLAAYAAEASASWDVPVHSQPTQTLDGFLETPPEQSEEAPPTSVSPGQYMANDSVAANSFPYASQETAPPVCTAPEPTAQDSVATEEALECWLLEHEETGGRVQLETSLTLTRCITANTGSGLTIETGPHGLLFDGGWLDAPGLDIVGEGVTAPVVQIRDTGSPIHWPRTWSYRIHSLNITATGRDGMGGTAVEVLQNDPYPYHFEELSGADGAQGRIHAYGQGAVGLRLSNAMDAYFLNITAEGSNSRAVDAPAGAWLYYCRLTATGEGAAAVAGGDILLDTCIASPQPPADVSISRRIVGTAASWLYVPVQMGAEMHPIDNPLHTFVLSGSGAYGSRVQRFWVNWDVQAVDTSVPGEQVIGGALLASLQGFGLEDIPCS